MQPAAGVADARDELPLDEAVHVLVGPIHPVRLAAPVFQDLCGNRWDLIQPAATHTAP